VNEWIQEGQTEIVVGAGHGIGKTIDLAGIACWAMATFDPTPIVITSAPTHRQVREQLWKEIRRLWNGAAVLRGMAEARGTLLKIHDGHYAHGFSTDQPGRFQGIHHYGPLIFIIDEGNEFPEDIWEAIDSCLTGGQSQLISIGNCVHPFGRFFRSFKSSRVCSTVISSREHPNVVSGRELIKGAVTLDWIKRFEEEWKSAPHVIQSRIDGIFPTGTNQAIIKYEWLQKAKLIRPATRWPSVLSVDVARFGENLTCVAHVRGQEIAQIEKWGHEDTVETARRVKRMAAIIKPEHIVVDAVGVGGGVADQLRAEGFAVYDFLSGAKPTSPKFRNLASESWWSARDAFENELVSLTVRDPKLELQLSSREWFMSADKLITIEPKENYSKRTGNSSPDEADAVTMGVWLANKLWKEAA
jgi:hypothetical protein